MKNIILIGLMVLSLNAFARTEPALPAGPKVSEVACKAVSANAVQVTGVASQVALTAQIADMASRISCASITFKKTSLIAVKYTGLSISNKQAPSKIAIYQVYHLENGKLRETFGANVDTGDVQWKLVRGHLTARIEMLNDEGKPMFGQGWVLNPKTSSFEDFIVYAIENNWPL